MNHAAMRTQRDEASCAQFGQFLDQPSLAIGLGQGDANDQLVAQLHVDWLPLQYPQIDLPAACLFDPRRKLAAAAVKQNDLVSNAHPQHVKQVVSLGTNQAGMVASNTRFDEEPVRHFKIQTTSRGIL
jgi:hypothetical protein